MGSSGASPESNDAPRCPPNILTQWWSFSMMTLLDDIAVFKTTRVHPLQQRNILKFIQIPRSYPSRLQPITSHFSENDKQKKTKQKPIPFRGGYGLRGIGPGLSFWLIMMTSSLEATLKVFWRKTPMMTFITSASSGSCYHSKQDPKQDHRLLE